MSIPGIFWHRLWLLFLRPLWGSQIAVTSFSSLPSQADLRGGLFSIQPRLWERLGTARAIRQPTTIVSSIRFALV